MKISMFSVQDHHPELPRTVAGLYGDVMSQCIEAEALGYEGAFIAEHHFHEYGAVPNPSVLLAAIAQKTSRLKLGPAVTILPFHHPLTVAENYAMLDVISGGRLMLGVGSGYLKHEFGGYSVAGEEKRDRFDESLGLLHRALAGERITHHGKYYDCDDAQLQVLPVQKPVPVYVAVLRREAAYHIGKAGHSLMTVPYATLDRFDEVREFVGEYQRGWREGGRPGKGPMLFAFHAFAARTDEECRRMAAEPFNLYVRTRLYAKSQTYDDILKSGLSLFGTVDQLSAKFRQLSEIGIDHLLLLQDFGAMPLGDTLSSMRLFAKEVLPRANV